MSSTAFPLTLLRNSTLSPYVTYLNTFGVATIGVFIFIFFLAGIFFNIITIYVIMKSKEYRNIFTCLLLSLCISDVLSAIVSPLFWYRRTIGFDQWQLSDVLCRFYFGMDMMTSCVTTLHIMTFILLRFIAIKYPNMFHKIKYRHAIFQVTFLWVFCAVTVFVPFALFHYAAARNRESNDKDARWTSCSNDVYWYSTYQVYVMVAMGLLLYVPMIIIIIFSVIVACMVRARLTKGDKNGRRSETGIKSVKNKEQQIFFQLMLVVLSFLIGYLPSAIYAIWTETHERHTVEYGALDYWLLMICYVFLRLSECLDPIFYTLGNTKLRNNTKRCIVKIFPWMAKYIKLPEEITIVTSSGHSTKLLNVNDVKSTKI